MKRKPMTEPTDPWEIDARAGYVGTFGTILTREEPQGRAFAFRVGAQHLDAYGELDQGAFLVFADHFVGCAALETFGVAQVTLQLQTNFVTPARQGELVEGCARLIDAVDRLGFLRGTAQVGDRVIATCDGIWKHVRPL